METPDIIFVELEQRRFVTDITPEAEAPPPLPCDFPSSVRRHCGEDRDRVDQGGPR